MKHKCLEEAAFLRTRLRKEKTMKIRRLPPISMRMTKNKEVYYVPPKPVWNKWGLDFDYNGWSPSELDWFRKRAFSEAQAKEFLRRYLSRSVTRGIMKMLADRVGCNLKRWFRLTKWRLRK